MLIIYSISACKFAGCNERFKNEVKLKSHQIFHDSNDLKVLADHTPGYECDVCQMKFTIKGNMMRHQHKFHSLNLPFGCIYCSSRFRTERMMKTHVERKHSKISSPQPIQNLKQIVQPSSSGMHYFSTDNYPVYQVLLFFWFLLNFSDLSFSFFNLINI